MDHAFTVAGGRTVKKAQRLEQGSNVGWRITVRPDGNGQVVIVLPETTDCDAHGQGAQQHGHPYLHGHREPGQWLRRDLTQRRGRRIGHAADEHPP